LAGKVLGYLHGYRIDHRFRNHLPAGFDKRGLTARALDQQFFVREYS
jgi:hypothetical protein